MKNKIKIAVFATLIAIFVLTTAGYSQYSGYGWGTTYMLVNVGSAPTDVTIKYYDANGQEVVSAQRTFTDLGPNESRLVVQPRDDTNLSAGQRYSAVVFADQPISAIVNQELYPSNGTLNPAPPFASYSGASETEVGTDIFLPSVMYNWYDYYTEVTIMNATTSPAHVTITYTPSKMNGQMTGATGKSETNITIPGYASVMKSQQSLSMLGATSGTYGGRFYGSAKIHSDQNITVVVNQNNTKQYKLMTYNGFNTGATKIAIPSHMRGYFKYYTATTVINMSSSDKACVRFTYNPDTSRSITSSGAVGPVVVEKVIDPLVSVIRYDGPGATDDQSDLDDSPVYKQFYGSIIVESFVGSVGGVTCSTQPDLAVLTNVEAVATGDSQGGSYTGIPITDASTTMISPNILSDFYGYYTNLAIQNTENTAGTCTITYTSGPDSAVPNHTESYDHPIGKMGVLTIYEGRKGGLQIGDINQDAVWRNASGKRHFIGSATITCNVKVVGFTNEEKDILYRDSMYTYNNINP